MSEISDESARPFRFSQQSVFGRLKESAGFLIVGWSFGRGIGNALATSMKQLVLLKTSKSLLKYCVYIYIYIQISEEFKKGMTVCGHDVAVNVHMIHLATGL